MTTLTGRATATSIQLSSHLPAALVGKQVRVVVLPLARPRVPVPTFRFGVKPECLRRERLYRKRRVLA